MTTLYLVVSPSGKLAYVGTDEAQAEFYRPIEAGNPYDTAYNEGYELFTVKADMPWLTEREENRGRPNNDLPA